MYLTDYREETLKDVITKIEPDLFNKVTGISVKIFEKMVTIGLFKSTLMNEAVIAFKIYGFIPEFCISYLKLEVSFGKQVPPKPNFPSGPGTFR